MTEIPTKEKQKEVLITDGVTKPKDMPAKVWQDIQAKMAELDCSNPQGDHECSKGSGNECSSQPEDDAYGTSDLGVETYRGIAVEPEGLIYKTLKNSFYQVLDLCFDEVLKEPKNILMIGGCHQRLFAQHIALMLPGAKIHLLDTDKTQVETAEAEICCRFQFDHAESLEKMDYPDGKFDLIIAGNLPQFAEVSSANAVMTELKRVLTANQGNIYTTGINATSYRWIQWLPVFSQKVRQYLKVQGIDPDFQTEQIWSKDWKEALDSQFEVGSNYAPIPFKVIMTKA